MVIKEKSRESRRNFFIASVSTSQQRCVCVGMFAAGTPCCQSLITAMEHNLGGGLLTCMVLGVACSSSLMSDSPHAPSGENLVTHSAINHWDSALYRRGGRA